MAGPGKNPELEMFIDVKAKTGQVNMDEFFRVLVNGLERASVPTVSIAPNVVLDKTLTAAKIKKILKGAAEQAKGLSDAYKADSSLGKADPRLVSAYANASSTFNEALTLLSQKQLKEHFAGVNKKLLSQAKSNITAGKALTPQQDKVFKQYGEGVALLEKQLSQLAARLTKLSSGAASFPVDLSQAKLLTEYRSLVAAQKEFAKQRAADDKLHEKALIDDIRHEKEKLRVQAAQLDAAQRLARYQQILTKGGSAGFANLTRTEKEEAAILRQMIAAGQRRAGDIRGAAVTNAQYAAAAGDTSEYEIARRLAGNRAGLRQLRQQAAAVTIGKLTDEDRAYLMRGLAQMASDYRALGRDKLGARMEGEAARLRRENSEREAYERRVKAEAKKNADRLARDQQRAAEAGARAQAAYGRMDPLLRQASTGGLGSLSPQQRHILQSSLKEFTGRLGASGQQSAIEYAAKLTAVYNALAKAERDVESANRSRTRQMAQAATAEQASIGRLARIAQLEQQIAGAAGSANALDVDMLAKQYERQIQHYDRTGKDQEAAELRAKLNAIRNPAAAAEEAARALEISRGNQVLSNVGGLGGVGNVNPAHAQFVQAALEEQRRGIGSRLSTATPGTSNYADLTRQLNEVDDAVRRLHTNTQRTNGVVAQFFRYALGYGALWQMLGALKGVVTGVTDLERALTAIKAVSGATDVEMQSVSTAIFSVGKNSRYTMAEVTGAAKILAQAGVSADKMGSALKNVTNLASAIEAPIAVVADLMTSMKEIFSAESDTSLANQLASAVNISKLTAEGLQTIIGLSGNVSESMNLTSQQYLAAVATLKNAGLKDSTVATGMRQLLLELQAPDDKLVKAFQERYAAIGEKMTASAVKDKLFEMFQGPGGLNKALVELERLGYNNAGRQTFSRAFDIRSQNALEALIRERQSLLGNEAKIGFSQASVIGSQQQMETLQARITELKNSFILFGDSVGKDALPPLMDFIETVSKAVQGLTELNEQMRSETGVGMGGVFGTAALGAATGFAFTGGAIAQRGVGALKGAGFGAGAGYFGMQADGAESGSAGEMVANGAAYGLMALQAYSLLRGANSRNAAAQMGPNQPATGVAAKLEAVITFVSALASSLSPAVMGYIRVALGFLAGPWGLAIAGITALVSMVVFGGKTAAEKAEQMKRQLESTNRLALEKSDAYRTQRDSVAELNVNNASTATGMGAKVIDVEDAYARVQDVVSGYVGTAADDVIERLAFIGAHGGTSALSNRGAIAELKKFEGLANITDAKLSELVGMASEAVAGPAALAESLTKTYAQLKGMDYEKLNDGQKALIYAFEMTGRAREGFAKTATEQMMQIRNLFRLAEQKSKELEGVSGAAEEANKALNNSRNEMRKTFKRGDFMSMKTAVMEWAVALDSMGKSAVAYLRQEVDILASAEKELRAKAEAKRKQKTGNKRYDERVEEQAREIDAEANSLRDARIAASGEVNDRTYEASNANTSLRSQLTSFSQQFSEAKEFFGGDLSQFSASTGYAEAMALMAAASPEELAVMQSKDVFAKTKGGALPSARITGDGQIDPGAGLDNIEKFGNIVGTKMAQIKEEREKRGATETELSRFRADRLRDNAIKDIDQKISSAGQLGEIDQLFNPIDGGKNIFDRQRALVNADFVTELGNAKLAADAFSTDPRTKKVEVKYEKFNKDQIEIAEKHAAKLNEIANDEMNKARDLAVKKAEAEKKTAEGVLKVEQERLDTVVSIGGAAADVVPAIDAQQKAHEAVAAAISKTVYEQQKKEDGDEAAIAAGKEAAALYLEQNVSLAKQVEYLAKAAANAAKITDSEIARQKISMLGMTPGGYAYNKGLGYTESIHDIRAQDEMDLYKQRELYDKQRGLLSAGMEKLRAAEAAGTAKEIAAAQAELDGLNDQLDATETRMGVTQAKMERNTLGGGLRYGLGIGPEGDRAGGLRDIANGQLANSWTEMGDAMRGGIVSSIDAIGDSLARAIVNGEKFKDVFKGLVNSIAVDLASFFAKKAVWWFLSSFLGGMPGVGASTSGGGDFRGPVGIRKAHGGTLRFSGGGMISGPGTGTSDSIPGMLVDGNRRQPLLLSNGESVLTAKATNMLGADFITAANRGNVRRQVAAGAAISRGGAVTNIASGNQTTNNLEVNVPVSMSSSAQGTDMDATVAQKLAAKVKSTVRETMMEEARPGGLLYRR